jgi:hypothetical protein
VHCRNLATIAAIDGEDSPQYREYLAKVIKAQKDMKGNFKLIAMLEKMMNALSKNKPEEARLVREGEELINPCKRTNQQ